MRVDMPAWSSSSQPYVASALGPRRARRAGVAVRVVHGEPFGNGSGDVGACPEASEHTAERSGRGARGEDPLEPLEPTPAPHRHRAYGTQNEHAAGRRSLFL